MLKAYVDDSGSEPNSPIFVLAGYVLPAEAWARFSDEWDKEPSLPNPKPIAYLHMSETGKDVDGEFSGWTIEEIEQKLLPLAAIIQRYHPGYLVCRARWSEYQQFKTASTMARLIGNPFKALFYEIIKLMYGFGEHRNNPQAVDFVFDGHGEIGAEAVSWYYDTKCSFPPEAKPFFGATPGFEDDKKTMPLQAADMIAWYQRRKYSLPVNRAAQKEMSSLISEHLYGTSEMDADGFEKAALDFARVESNRKG